jgi:hypothetical protein
MIQLDATPISVVVTCDECPYWHAFAWTRAEGWAAAARHEQIVHPGRVDAQRAASKYRGRHHPA